MLRPQACPQSTRPCCYQKITSPTAQKPPGMVAVLALLGLISMAQLADEPWVSTQSISTGSYHFYHHCLSVHACGFNIPFLHFDFLIPSHILQPFHFPSPENLLSFLTICMTTKQEAIFFLYSYSSVNITHCSTQANQSEILNTCAVNTNQYSLN